MREGVKEEKKFKKHNKNDFDFEEHHERFGGMEYGKHVDCIHEKR